MIRSQEFCLSVQTHVIFKFSYIFFRLSLHLKMQIYRCTMDVYRFKCFENLDMCFLGDLHLFTVGFEPNIFANSYVQTKTFFLALF